MIRDRIEIKPGVFIEVTRRVKNRAGVGQRVVGTVRNPHSLIPKSHTRKSKHNPVLLDEAIEMLQRMGRNKVCKATGLTYDALDWEIERRRKAGIDVKMKHSQCGKKSGRPPLAPMAVRMRCYEIARQMIASRMYVKRARKVGRAGVAMVMTPNMTTLHCWSEAGRIAGCNGITLMEAVRRGDFPPNNLRPHKEYVGPRKAKPAPVPTDGPCRPPWHAGVQLPT
jgi:hypothetical protein